MLQVQQKFEKAIHNIIAKGKDIQYIQYTYITLSFRLSDPSNYGNLFPCSIAQFWYYYVYNYGILLFKPLSINFQLVFLKLNAFSGVSVSKSFSSASYNVSYPKPCSQRKLKYFSEVKGVTRGKWFVSNCPLGFSCSTLNHV